VRSAETLTGQEPGPAWTTYWVTGGFAVGVAVQLTLTPVFSAVAFTPVGAAGIA
jgi:hypothetical protein